MSDSEFYHEALVRRLRERDDCDDDIRGACDEIEDCYETIARLRLTDAEREAVEDACNFFSHECETDGATDDDYRNAATLRGLLERMK